MNSKELKCLADDASIEVARVLRSEDYDASAMSSGDLFVVLRNGSEILFRVVSVDQEEVKR